MIGKSFVIIILTCWYASTYACTAFILQDKENTYLCKNFDWEDGSGIIMFNPAGQIISLEQSKAHWTAKYSSITFSSQQAEYTIGGINERGLVIEELSTLPFYIKADSLKLILNEFQWIKYHLDMCATVDEVVQCQEHICLVPEIYHLHYMISDAFGNAAIIEFSNKGAKIFRHENMPFNVLSNNLYENSLAYLSNFVGFGGSQAIPKSDASCDRFVMGVKLCGDNMGDQTSSREKCFEILDSLKQYDTQWQIVYDIPERKIHLRLKGSASVHIIDLQSFDGNRYQEQIQIDLGYCLSTKRMNAMINNHWSDKARMERQ